ncbi:hypothetical protein [Methanococcus aeolicus]|uniref:hypothetical protein n=1 Tax=Methanococcus aeolicus TaxID=42879 RepID=UPI0021CA1680|nr:hypothetical protein [Methanococcus aeolicus]UXM84771.1 hypothetical protein N6C89_00275 [Methanococcus aeolicus]
MAGGYHIRHNAKPEVIRKILEVMYYNNLSKRDEIKNSLPQHIKTVIDESIIIKNKIISNNEIENLLEMDEITFNNYLHYRMYSSEEPTGWSYRNVIDILYNEYCEKKINMLDIEQKIKEQALEEGIEKISFSQNSVRGALNFISSLEPNPVDDNNIFNLRNYCQPHLILWGIDYIYNKQWDGEYDSLILLDDEKIEELCKFAMIDRDNFDSILKQCDMIYNFLEVSTKLFGKSIRLNRKWTFGDII